MSISERATSPETRASRCVLPSGLTIDIDRPNLSVIRDEADFMDVIYRLQEKIIDIELQIDMAECGVPFQVGKPRDPTWVPRTKAALKWAKLHRDEAAKRSGLVSRANKREQARALEHRFIATAKAMLDEDTYARILAVVNAREVNGEDK